MKNLILTLLVAFGFGNALMAGNPVYGEKCCPVVVSSADVDFAYDESVYSKYFAPAYFNEETKSLHFESKHNISFIEITNADGELEYKLPVMSNKVRLSKGMFEKGEYKLEFDLKNSSDALVTYVTIN